MRWWNEWACCVPYPPRVVDSRSMEHEDMHVAPNAVMPFSASMNVEGIAAPRSASVPMSTGEYSSGNRSEPSPVDKLMEICLLQKADGSFELTDDLLRAIGLSSTKAAEIKERHGLSDPFMYAACIVIVAFRLQFPKKREIWELQHNKAVTFLASNGVVDLDKKLLALEVDVKSALV